MALLKKDKVAFGTMGCGDIVQKAFVPAVKANPRAVLLAATRSDASKLDPFCRQHGIERAYPSVEAMLRDPDIDVVYVATPVAFHLPQVAAAAEHGKHVLCEKPLAMNWAQAQEAARVCTQYGVKFSVAYYRRRYPEILEILRLFEEQRFGSLLSLQFHLGAWLLPPGGSPPHWRFDISLSGGGALIDGGSHRVDLVHYLAGSVRRVFCRLAFPSADSREAETGATALFDLDNGGEAQVAIYYNQKERTDTVHVYGSRANLKCPMLGGGTLILEENGTLDTIHVKPTAKGTTHIPVIEGVVGELLDGTFNPFAAERVLPTEKLLDACYRSAKEGCWITVDGA